MLRRLFTPLVACTLLAITLTAQSSSPTFEVATIKHSTSGEQASFRWQPGGRVTVTNTTLHGIIRTSYGIEDFQVVGGPAWVNSDRWDIIAKAADNAVAADLDRMMQSLLDDRFKLRMHSEVRRFQILALARVSSSGRLGSSIHVSTADCASVTCGFSGVAGNLAATGRTLVQFSRVLTPLVGRPVVDKTETNEAFDWTLKWAPDTRTDADGPSLVTALQEQLGLTLEQQDAQVSVLVIDSVERASDN